MKAILRIVPMTSINYIIFMFFFACSSLQASLINLDDLSIEERGVKLKSIYVPTEITDRLFQITKDVVDVLTEHHIPHMASFGTILDLKRHTTIVNKRKVAGIKKHDDDIDLAIDLCDSSRLGTLAPIFEALKYKLLYDPALSRWIVEAQEMSVVPLVDGGFIGHLNFLDIFVFKREGERYDLAEERARELPYLENGWFTADEFNNRQLHNFGTINITAPGKANNYLKRKYGPNCLSQAYFSSNHIFPDHQNRYIWTLTEEERVPALPTKKLQDRFAELKVSHGYAGIQKNIYWNEFYANNQISSVPSSFAAFVKKHHLKHHESLLEFGCGNGRDAFEFSQEDMLVTAVDSSGEVIKQNTWRAEHIKHNAPKFGVVDVKSQEQLSKLKGFQNIYARFFMHALTPSERLPIMKFFGDQVHGTKLFLEFRTDKDPLLQRSNPRINANEGFADGHYRCFINYESFIRELHKLGFEILHGSEQNGLSIVQKEGYVDNPFLARIVARKL